MAEYSLNRGVAVIRLAYPPLNALSQKVRKGLSDGIKRAEKDSNVKAVVVCGNGGNFSAGADITEFGGAKTEPWITQVGDQIDALKKPVVAAIEGVALGGGLEVALFCHYRIASNKARVGFPEVLLGLLPGAGGTQRLPRVAGLQTAIEMITSGAHMPAEKACKLGILDKVVSGNVVEEGVQFALSKAHLDTSLVCLRNRKVKVPGDLDQITQAALAKVKTKYRGFNAPVDCVRAVMASAQLPSYEAGMDRERELFQELMMGNQSAAQRYAFFAERAITRWRLPNGGSYKTAKPMAVKTTAVIGAGTMGGGIALSLITSGIPCILVEQDRKFLDKGLELMKAQLMGTVQRGKMSAEQAKKCEAILKPTVNIEDVKDVDLVIEAVYEDLKLKHEIFTKLDKICKPATILCSNTSTLDIDKIASVVKRRDKVVGTHFFAPSYIMKLLENIYGKDTSAETVATVMKLGKTIKKVPVLVGTCTGFVANRMGGPYAAESLFLVEEGATVEQITRHEQDFGMPMGRFEARFLVEEGAQPSYVDHVLRDFGMPMGTFAVSDLSGLDVGYRIKREAARAAGVELTMESRFFLGERNCSLTERLVEKGRLGKKVGKGWYKYSSPTARASQVDAEVTEIVEQHRRTMGITPRTIGSQEILERMQFAMINEGFKILEEGLCTMPQEIDVIWFYGFSWPKHTGGPMFYANQIGLERVYDRICYYHEQFPHSMHWVPSRLLAKLSKTNVPMDKWGDVARGASKL